MRLKFHTRSPQAELRSEFPDTSQFLTPRHCGGKRPCNGWQQFVYPILLQ
jgi:hypothetical protein